MTVEEAKQKVLAVWPDTVARNEMGHTHHSWRAYRVKDGAERNVGLGDSEQECWHDITTSDAFTDAASKLPTESKLAPEDGECEDMCPDCMSNVRNVQLNLGTYRCDNKWHCEVE